MRNWNTIDDLVSHLMDEFEAAKMSGADHEAAVARCAAALAVRRDDIGQIGISYGLAEIVLRHAAAVKTRGRGGH